MQTTDRSESKLIEDLRAEGFTHHMIYQDGAMFVDQVNPSEAYRADQVKIKNSYRFEGLSNPGDMSIAYALQTVDGFRGSIVVAYGPNGNLEAAEFFKKVEENS